MTVQVVSRKIQRIETETMEVKDVFSYSNLDRSFNILVCVMVSVPLRGSKRNFVAIGSKQDSLKWHYRALLLGERNDGQLGELCRVEIPETTPTLHAGEVVEWTQGRVMITHSGMQSVHIWKAGEASVDSLAIPFPVEKQNRLNIHCGMYAFITRF